MHRPIPPAGVSSPAVQDIQRDASGSQPRPAVKVDRRGMQAAGWRWIRRGRMAVKPLLCELTRSRTRPSLLSQNSVQPRFRPLTVQPDRRRLREAISTWLPDNRLCWRGGSLRELSLSWDGARIRRRRPRYKVNIWMRREISSRAFCWIAGADPLTCRRMTDASAADATSTRSCQLKAVGAATGFEFACHLGPVLSQCVIRVLPIASGRTACQREEGLPIRLIAGEMAVQPVPGDVTSRKPAWRSSNSSGPRDRNRIPTDARPSASRQDAGDAILGVADQRHRRGPTRGPKPGRLVAAPAGSRRGRARMREHEQAGPSGTASEWSSAKGRCSASAAAKNGLTAKPSAVARRCPIRQHCFGDVARSRRPSSPTCANSIARQQTRTAGGSRTRSPHCKAASSSSARCRSIAA